MVAGCAMGAACLAMPMLTAAPGFIFSAISILVVGLVSYILASISLEIFLVYKNNVNIASVAGKSFGKFGILLSGIINITLMYALLCVYMTGGADLLNKTILPIFGIHLHGRIALVIFLLIMIPVFFKGAELVVQANKIVFFIKMISFLCVVLLGFRFLSTDLFIFTPLQLSYLPQAIPVLFGALWFHFMIPVIARLNNYNRSTCRKIFVVGLSIPVILYILWIGFMLSLIPLDGSGNSFTKLLTNKESVGMMINYATHNNPNLPSILIVLLNVFSNIAMLTSFLTVGISTYDYIRDALKIQQSRRGILDNLALTMLPPAFFALFFPNGFVFILQQAVILLILINIFMLACCLKEYDSLEVKPQRWFIWGLIGVLLYVIALQLADNLNLLPSVG
jgi:tyrosine-specific transport protein